MANAEPLTADQSFTPLQPMATLKRLTKVEAVRLFSEQWRELLEHQPQWKDDTIAKREAFHNFVDSLNKDRLISDSQANRWSNPY